MSSHFADPLLLFDFTDRAGRPKRICFTHPEKVIVAHSINEVRPALQAAESAAAEGYYAAGYVSFEAAPAFDSAFMVRSDAPQPLVWFGLFRAPMEASHEIT